MATSPPKKPLDELQAPANAAYSSSWPTRYPLAVAALAMQLFGNFLIAFVLNLRGSEVVGNLAIGFLFGQVALLAIWTAWAPASLFLRVGGGLLLTGFVALTLAICIWRHLQTDVAAPLLFSLVFFGQWLLSQALLWLLRGTMGLRIVSEAGARPESSRRDAQFGLRQLLLLTACVAILLGAARWAFPPATLEAVRRDMEGLAVAVILATFNTLAPLPALWACFAPKRLAPVWLPAAVIYVVGMIVVENYTLAALNQGPARWFILWSHFALFAVVVPTLLAFRKYGFRLQSG